MKTKEDIMEYHLQNEGYHPDTNRILAAMEDYATQDKWISVKDNLPYKDGDSRVYCLVNDIYYGIVVRPFNEGHHCWDDEDGDDFYTEAVNGKITHWQPLPDSPKNK